MPASAVRRALLSVSDKTGLVEFATFLNGKGVELVSTGGTAKAIADAGLTVREVSDLTGFPEMLDGRVKTLHPNVHGGLLGVRGNADHEATMADRGIAPIDLVVVNLYPFESTVAAGAGFDTCIENIDIGGPAMIRSAAKNHAGVAVIVDPKDYDEVQANMEAHDGAVTDNLRTILAARAFSRTAAYDSAISTWFADQLGDAFPHWLSVSGTKKQDLRYGENPHQQAALYLSGETRPGVASAEKIQGKELSYNNINDTDAAFELVAEFDQPAVAIIKHANPCGVAVADNCLSAYAKALACDPVSAFGGIVALNRPLDGALAAEIIKLFTEVVIAPNADDAARSTFAKKKNLRLLLTGDMPDISETVRMVKPVAGGLLAQSKDTGHITAEDLKAVTKVKPSDDQTADMLFAFTIAKHVKSNTIIYAKDGATVGIGAGQMSRVDSARIAAAKAMDAAKEAGICTPATVGSVVASDAFFPFTDGLLAAVEAGATAVIQPGGSIRDDEVIAAADEKGLAMVFTGMRHFRH
ncbi:MAG: bifunctional phosphoribosylaminoimidazolecarboxamide formyltransferase/IMP cyclohydrolase [Rhodospirillaceae bacterium]|nr:bifunctional phosphoribosylaminoimidazolecarboxamide formyltransferase/IMP cyclohydrolase [Rhodospirillaceae bacterium]